MTVSGIPFQLPDVGLREIGGKIFLDEEFLIFEVEDALAGEFDKDVQVIKVAPSALEEVRFEPRIVRDRLYVRPKKRDLLDAMPGTYGLELPLRIWRTHRNKVMQLVDELYRRTKGVTVSVDSASRSSRS